MSLLLSIRRSLVTFLKGKGKATIKGVHRLLDTYPSSDVIRLEKELQNQYNEVLAQEELLQYQKSRKNWVKFGNKNTKFFHTQTIIQRRRNKITGLDIGGNWRTNEGVLKMEKLNLFLKLPSNPLILVNQRVRMSDLFLKSVMFCLKNSCNQ